MAITKEARLKVFRRDGWRCHYCGHRGDSRSLQVDYRRPEAQGGTDHMNNLVTACRSCNQEKGATRARSYKVKRYRRASWWGKLLKDLGFKDRA